MKNWFSKEEIRGLLLFLPLAALAVAALLLARRKYDPEPALRAEAMHKERVGESAAAAGADTLRTLRLHAFDPNEVTYEELCEMGLTRREAAGLIRYREAGKRFRIPEDVAECFTIGDTLYRLLKPHIAIGEAYRFPKRVARALPAKRPVWKLLDPAPFRIDTVSAAYLRAIGALTKRQAEAFIRWRDLHGIRDLEEFRESFVVSDSLADALAPYLIFPEREPHPIEHPVELNRADSAELCRVAGIGPTTAGRIVAYRERLGGFVRVEQLAEVRGMTERNYEKILKQICLDSCEIQKIDINFVAPKKLEDHPYIGPSRLRKLSKIRQLKGGWHNAEEMVDDHIFTREEAARVAPYLVFRPFSNSGNN